MFRRAALALVVTGGIGCHVTGRVEVTRVAGTSRVVRPDPPRALPATLVVTDAGELRFIELLRCTSDEILELETTEVVRTRPNLATVIVGITASSLGGLGLVMGLNDDEPAASPLTYGGGALLAAGLPLAIGPWFGRRTRYRDIGVHTTTRAIREEPCGERGVAGEPAATLSAAGLRVVGTVDGAGTFSVSPFQIVDAFDATARALDVTAELTTAAGATRVRAVLEPGALGRGRAGYLRDLGVDASVEPMRAVPRIEPGPVRVSRVAADGRASLRVALAIRNAGPGDAYAVRGRVAAAAPEIDGRLIYFGRIPANATITREIVVPLSEAADRALARTPLDLAIELADAHGTTPDAPARYRGPVPHERALGGAP